MLLSTSDFTVRPYRILNLEESKDFIDFARQAEKKILIDILGYPLWTDVDQGVESGESGEDILTELKDGAEYSYSDKTYKYNGLVDLLKPAVLSMWINKNNYRFTSTGYIENKPQDNTTLLDPEPFIVELWNEFVVKVGGGNSGYGYGYSYYGPLLQGTFYGYMTANKDSFPEWRFTEQKLKNRYGL